MKKVVIGSGVRRRPNTRKVLEYNVETPGARRHVDVNDKGEHIATEFAQLEGLDVYETISLDFKSILKQKSKAGVKKTLQNILDQLPKLCQEYDEIGLGGNARQVKRSIRPSLEQLLEDLNANTVKPSIFLTRITNIQNLFTDLSPKAKTVVQDDIFSPVKDIFKSANDVRIVLKQKTPAEIIKIPVSMFLRRKLSDLCRVTLEKNFGAQFVPYTGAVLLTNMQFLVINKAKFDTPDMKSVTSSVLAALFRNKDIVPVYQIAKDTAQYYAVLCINQSYLRIMTELVAAIGDIKLHTIGAESE